MDVEKLKSVKILPKDKTLIKDLAQGKTITLSDGRVITSDQVLSDEVQTAEHFIVVECPNQSFLPSLLDSEQLRRSDIDIVVHMSPADIVDLEE